MKYAIIPKMLFETEDIVALMDKGLQFESGDVTIGKTKVPCYRFHNLDEMEVFDILYTKMYESNDDQEKLAFANKATSLIFIQIRKVSAIKNPELKVCAVNSLSSAVMSLAAVNARIASRFLSLVRSLQ